MTRTDFLKDPEKIIFPENTTDRPETRPDTAASKKKDDDDEDEEKSKVIINVNRQKIDQIRKVHSS